jgi:hypothetical protein
MMRVIANYSEGVSFWEANPQFKVKEPFKFLYQSDKSKGKKGSSTMMWFVAWCYDRESIFYNQPIDEKYSIVGEDYCGDISYYPNNQDVLDEMINAFLAIYETQAMRSLRLWEKRMHKRDKFMDDTDYSEDTYKMKEEMVKNSPAMYKEFEKIKKDLSVEQAGSSEGKGGSVESASDSGEI